MLFYIISDSNSAIDCNHDYMYKLYIKIHSTENIESSQKRRLRSFTTDEFLKFRSNVDSIDLINGFSFINNNLKNIGL